MNFLNPIQLQSKSIDFSGVITGMHLAPCLFEDEQKQLTVPGVHHVSYYGHNKKHGSLLRYQFQLRA